MLILRLFINLLPVFYFPLKKQKQNKTKTKTKTKPSNQNKILHWQLINKVDLIFPLLNERYTQRLLSEEK